MFQVCRAVRATKLQDVWDVVVWRDVGGADRPAAPYRQAPNRGPWAGFRVSSLWELGKSGGHVTLRKVPVRKGGRTRPGLGNGDARSWGWAPWNVSETGQGAAWMASPRPSPGGLTLGKTCVLTPSAHSDNQPVGTHVYACCLNGGV